MAAKKRSAKRARKATKSEGTTDMPARDAKAVKRAAKGARKPKAKGVRARIELAFKMGRALGRLEADA